MDVGGGASGRLVLVLAPLWCPRIPLWVWVLGGVARGVEEKESEREGERDMYIYIYIYILLFLLRNTTQHQLYNAQCHEDHTVRTLQ